MSDQNLSARAQGDREDTAAWRDLQHLLAAVDVAALFLDRQLRIIRFTQPLGELTGVRLSDRGRPFSDLAHRLGDHGLADDARQVLDSLVPISREIPSENGRWYLTRILPYPSAQDRIDGVVLTVADVTDRKRAEEALRDAKIYAESIVETLHEPVLVLTPDLRVQSVNPAFYDHFEVEEEATLGRLIYELGNGQWDIPELRTLLEEVLPDNEVFNDYLVRHKFEDIGERIMLINARRLDHVQFILLGIRDVTEHERTAEALRESEEHHRLIVESARDYAILTTDPEGRIESWSPGAEVVFGWRAEEAIGQPLAVTFTPEDRAAGEPEKECELARHNGSAPDVRWHLRKDGARVFIEGTVRVLHGADGGVRGFLKIGQDVTERRQTEQALRESEQRFRQMADAVPQIVWITDAEGRTLFFNRQWTLYTGREYEPTTASQIAATTVHPDDAALTMERFVAAQRTGTTFEVEHRIRAASGEYHWFLVRAEPYRDPSSGEIIRWFGASTDIHDRKMAEAALRENERRFRQMAEAVPDAVFTTTSDGVVEYVSPRREEMTGQPPENALGTRMWPELIHPDDRPRAEAERDAAYARCEPFESRYRVRTTTGEYRWFIARARPIFAHGGEVVRWFGTLSDVDDFTRAEEALRRLNETLEQRVEERTREVRQQEARVRELSLALTLAEQQERQRIAHVLHDDLQQILFGARVAAEVGPPERVAELLRQAMELTRTLSHDLSPPVLQGEDLDDLLRWIAERQRMHYGLEVEVEVASGVPVPSVDLRVLLFQLLRELLFNVAKHARTSRARVVADYGDGHVRVGVEDEGAGFDPTMLDDPSAAGLGLSSVRKRLELVGGRMEVASAPGRGTRITLWIPVPQA